jgi:CMP-N,N'-diacetyllegionaminic acid synthase
LFRQLSVICVIPARGGSKGLPGKNIRELNGRPLIAYSIEQALKSRYIDKVVVSTDDRKIADVASSWGADVPFLRPPELSTDTASTIDVLLHCLGWFEKQDDHRNFDILVLLHATAPLRTVRDIDSCIELLAESGASNVFSVTEAHRNPYFNMVEVDHLGAVRLSKKGTFTTRQSAPKVYDLNASIYVWQTALLKKKRRTILKTSRVYVMPKERSVDIDDGLDFEIAALLQERISSGKVYE